MQLSRQARLIDGEMTSLHLQMSKVAKARDVLACADEKQGRQAATPNARTGLLKNNSDSLDQKNSTICVIKLVSRKEADCKIDMNGLVNELC